MEVSACLTLNRISCMSRRWLMQELLSVFIMEEEGCGLVCGFFFFFFFV